MSLEDILLRTLVGGLGFPLGVIFILGILNHWIKGKLGLWFCRELGWHPGPYKYTGFDGASAHAICPRCGYHGMEDSQGNLF